MKKYDTHDVVCPICSRVWYDQMKNPGPLLHLGGVIDACTACLGTYRCQIPEAEVINTRKRKLL